MIEMYRTTHTQIACNDDFQEFICSVIDDKQKLVSIFESVVGKNGKDITAMETIMLMNIMKYYVNSIAGGEFGMEDLTFSSMSMWVSFYIVNMISYDRFMNTVNGL